MDLLNLRTSWIPVFLAVFVHLCRGEILDFATLFKFHHNINPPTHADMEFHKPNEALGTRLMMGDSYFGHVVGTTPLHCDPAGPNCKWITSGEWRFNRLSTSDLTDITYVLPDVESISGSYDLFCSFNDGVCHVYCDIDAGECSCPENYRMNASDMCEASDPRFHIVDKDTGTFTITCNSEKWLIIAPEHKGIRLKMISSSVQIDQTYEIYVYGYSRHGTKEELLTQLIDNKSNYIFETKFNLLFVDIRSYNKFDKICDDQIIYEVEYSFTAEYLALKDDTGELSYSVPVLTRNICVSVSYISGSEKSSLEMKTRQDANKRITSNCSTKGGNSTYCRFKIELSPNYTQQNLLLSLTVSGRETTLLGVSQCNPFADVDITYIKRLPLRENSELKYNVFEDYKASPSRRHSSLSSVILLLEKYGKCHDCLVSGERNTCLNGGVLLPSMECQCPAGFYGRRCEKGCGPNRYGNECEGVCSMLGNACERILFCKKYLKCLCAPGYNGDYCHEPCKAGYYGAGCQNNCGNCRDSECDIFTGECHGGCLQGYYPPLCQETYAYLTIAPALSYKDMNLVSIRGEINKYKGQGRVKFYKLQIKQKDSAIWEEKYPEKVRGSVYNVNVTDLIPGTSYEARIICIDETGDSYQGHLVPVLEFVAPCNELTPEDLEVHAVANFTEIYVSWKDTIYYQNCKIKKYEVVVQKQWENKTTILDSTQNNLVLRNLMPAEEYEVKIRALTNVGWTPYSRTISVIMPPNAFAKLADLSAVSEDIASLTVSWKYPRGMDGYIKYCVVKYQCTRLLACLNSCEHSKGQVTVTEQSAKINNLIPHAQYRIEVAIYAETIGPFRKVYMATNDAEPNVAPGSSETPVVHRTNTSFAVQWTFPDNCSLLNGYFEKYRYELRDDASAESGRVIQFGYTGTTNATFRNLSPLTTYYVHVYVVTSGGWNPDIKRVISVTTTATVPEQVRNLSVYKSGRRMIGLRWSPPSRIYGSIKNFVISYQLVDRGDNYTVTDIVVPRSCTAWPEMFCHEINGLLANRRYRLEVSVRNDNVESNGDSTFIFATTKEGTAGAPLALAVHERSPTSVVLKWRLPSMINGVLRSFLLNVEQIDSKNTDDCCEYLPVIEVPVSEEQLEYFSKVGDLLPASKYVVSVSCKTVTIGPSTNITVSVPPLPPRLTKRPEVDTDDDRTLLVKIQPDDDPHDDLKSTYLLLMLSEEKVADPQIADLELVEQLDNLTQSLAGGLNYYIVAEYTREQLLVTKETIVATGVENRNGTWSILQDPLLETGTYRVGLALVLEYANAKSVGLVVSEPFDV